MTNRPISDLQDQFKKQLKFLERSADSFDEGFEDEDIRLAQTIRVLFHQTDRSHSIVNQLGINLQLIDSSCHLVPGNLVGEMPLLVTGVVGEKGPMFIAPLSKPTRKNKIPLENWWNQLVFRKEGALKFSRRRLILQLANKEGGSHVNPKLTPDFEEIKRDSLGVKFFRGTEEVPRNSAISATARQIAHEVLESLVRGYDKSSDTSGDYFMIAGQSVVIGTAIAKIPRNHPCPCESGLKYKKCHGFV